MRRDGARVIVLSEYGITAVSGAVHQPRAARGRAARGCRTELGRELLDAGASEAFAVADHQVAHVYVRRRERIAEVKRAARGAAGVERVLDDEGKRAHGLDHPRSGELVALAPRDRWFTYYYWLDDRARRTSRAPSTSTASPATTRSSSSSIPRSAAPSSRSAGRLLKKALGFRYLMDVIPLDASLVRGSHGRLPETPEAGPVLISSEPELVPDGTVRATDVKPLLLDHVFGPPS